MLLTAARIQAEVEQSQADATSACLGVAKSIMEEVRTAIPGSTLQFGAGGELVPIEELAPIGVRQEGNISGLVNTIANPDYVSADASRDRLQLAYQAGVLEAALDAADTIVAENSLEKMLAHQLAAMHNATMKLARQANRRVDRLEHMNLGFAEADRTTVEAVEDRRIPWLGDAGWRWRLQRGSDYGAKGSAIPSRRLVWAMSRPQLLQQLPER